MVYNFTFAEKGRFKKQGEGQANWTQLIPDKATKSLKTFHGVSIEFYVDATEPTKIASNKEAVLKVAIKTLQDAGLMFASSDVKKFRVVCYGATASLPSRGAVYFEGTGDAKPCVLLQLGTRVSKHVTTDTSASQTMPGPDGKAITVIGGCRTRPPKVVADRIYDYYKPTYTVSAKDKCALAQALHELGHIVHQLTKPADYWLNADVAGGDDTAKQQRLAEFDAIKTYGLKDVSQYAGTDAKSLNEYVAEVFCGLLMGIPWDTIDGTGGLMQTYRDLGGPVPTTMPEAISRLSAFKTVTCNCTTNDYGEAFKYW